MQSRRTELGEQENGRVTDRALGRIAALLRQAEGTDNEHEAAAFMAAAQRLATLESIDLAMARSHTERREKRAVPEQRTVTIGESGRRGLGTYVHLFVSIARANGVTCDIARNSTFVYAYGFGADIDVCEALYSSLVVQMVSACDRFLRAGGHHQDLRPARDRRTGRIVSKPVHATTARINFQNAFAGEVGTRLQAARLEANAEAERHYSELEPSSGPVAGHQGATSAVSSVALAVRQKELEIGDFYTRTSEARGAWRGSSARFSESSMRAGKRAGREAQLGGRTSIGGARRAVGRGD